VSLFSLCFSLLQFFSWQELVDDTSFSEDFDAVLSRFKSFFDDGNLFEGE